MKQTSKYAIVFLAGAIFATAGSAYGAEAVKTISAKLRPDIKVSVNGKQLDASAISYNNTTYLPLRKAAEAVGGKIELSGKDINIVTQMPSDIGNNKETPENKYEIEDKVLLEWTDVYFSLTKKNNYSMTSGVVNGRSQVYYNDLIFVVQRNIDYYYDPEHDKTYYPKDFFLQFLSESDLSNIPVYKVNVQNNRVSPI